MVRQSSVSENGPQSPHESYRRGRGRDNTSESARTETLLEILGDNFARQIFRLLSGQPRTGRELSNETEMSRASVYRRLNTLQKHGLVDSEMEPDPDGHHRKRFHTTVSGFDFHVESGQIGSQIRKPDGS
jgi:DNA-binding HxlR family transcriptional regulator